VNLSPSGIRGRDLDEELVAAGYPAKEFALPRAAALEGRWPDVLGLGALLFLTTLLVWQRLWLWNGLAYLDVSAFYLPWYSFLGEHLRALQIPGWNPHQFIGTPFAGDPQSGWMYLPAMFFFTLLPPVAAYKWFLIFHLALAGVSTYVFARALRLGVIGALAAAAAFEFGPLVNHISCCLIHVQLAVWIPPALLGIELGHRSERRWGRVAWWCLSALAVSQMAAAWVGQGVYNGLLVVAGYLFYRVVLSPGRESVVKTRMVDAVLAGAVIFGGGLALGAAGLLPRFAAIAETNVAGGQYSGAGTELYSSGWSPSVLFYRFMSSGHNYYSSLFYLGGATLTLAVAAPLIARRRSAVPFFAALTLVVSTLTLTHETLIHKIMFLLPRYRDLYDHVPTRVLAVQWLGPAMLAGAAIDAIARGKSDRRIRYAGPLLFTAWVAMAIYLAILREHIGWSALAAATTACAAFVAYAYAPWLRRAFAWDQKVLRRNLAILLLIAIIWEPTGRVFANAVMHGQVDPVTQLATGPVPSDAVDANAAASDPGGAGEFLQAATGNGQTWRYFGYDNDLQYGGWSWPSTYREWWFAPEAQSLLINARAMMLGLDDVQGYNPVQMTRYVDFLTTLNNSTQNYHDAQILPGGLFSPLLNLLNARYIVIPNDLSAGRPRSDLLALQAKYPVVFKNDQVMVLENADALPRAWIVHNASRATTESQLVVLADEQVDPRVTALIANASSLPALEAPTDPSRESVAVTGGGTDSVMLKASLQADGMVVVSDAYASGWNVYVDGQKATLYLTDGVLRSVAVPAGEHVIEFRYEPMALTLGRWTSGAAGIGMVGVLALALWERRKPVLLPRPAPAFAPSGD
jgi:hypothetical protein